MLNVEKPRGMILAPNNPARGIAIEVPLKEKAP
jgi:hypothetical protein